MVRQIYLVKGGRHCVPFSLFLPQAPPSSPPSYRELSYGILHLPPPPSPPKSPPLLFSLLLFSLRRRLSSYSDEEKEGGDEREKNKRVKEKSYIPNDEKELLTSSPPPTKVMDVSSALFFPQYNSGNLRIFSRGKSSQFST